MPKSAKADLGGASPESIIPRLSVSSPPGVWIPDSRFGEDRYPTLADKADAQEAAKYRAWY